MRLHQNGRLTGEASAHDHGSEKSEDASGSEASRLDAVAGAMLAERVALDRHLGSELFADPALDILLFLFAEGQDGGDVTTTACCGAARVPRTTALRWIRLLADRGLVVMSDDAEDGRMTLLRLSATAREAMKGWLREAAAGRSPGTSSE